MGTVVGIDEVGRGALAGPVVAAAVAQPEVVPGWWGELCDSKKIDPKGPKLARLASLISALPHGIGQASASEVDELGIHRAVGLAMERALQQLTWDERPRQPFQIMVDGNSNFGHESWKTYVRGDVIYSTIAAASIIAKWVLDRLMRIEIHGRFPEYRFDSHFGYGTRKHMAALRKHGPCEEHRRTFRGVM